MSNLASFSHTETLSASYTATKGLISGAGTLSRSTTLKLSNGTAAGQADGLFTADTALGAGSVDSYFLSAGLQNLYGEQLEFTAIKFIMIEADLTNTAPLVIGGGSWDGPFGDPSNTFSLQPGDTTVWKTTAANGWSVDPAADELRITSAASALYRISLCGVSSILSAPAWALHPEFTGTPRVGSDCTCTNGSVSGNPVLSYQWKRAGSVIAGATSADYTPVSADLNKALTRVTFAANIAGTVMISTAPAIVQAASSGGSGSDGVLDFSIAGNPLSTAV